MTTAVATQPEPPPMIRHYAQSLLPSEASKHRAWIGVRIEALLDGYWQTRPSDPVRATIMADWIAVLDGFDPGEITAACREWLRDEPRSKPRAGDIVAIIQRERAKAAKAWRASHPEPEEPPRERMTGDQSNAILAEYGFRPKRMTDHA